MRIAILEDDPDQADLVCLWLQDAGHSVSCSNDGASFLRVVRRDSYDMYMLDWVLPDMSGIEVLHKLRAEMADYTPVVIATVKDEERSIVTGLEAGADDYLVKPIRRAELVARISAILRRASGGKSEDDAVEAAPYVIDLTSQTISYDGRDVTLTNREFALAVFLFRNPGKMLSRAHILEAIWGIENTAVSTRTVDTHVSRLRRKLKLGVDNGWKLTAVYQHGYRIEKVGLEECNSPA